jgi:hypothetical protein
MELRRLFKPERFSQSAIPACDVTEREVGRKSLRIDGFRRCFRAWDRLLVFLCFHFRTILGREDLRALQIFIGVDVLWFFLLIFFPGFFLARGFGNILRVTLLKAKNRAGDDKNSGARKPYETRRGPLVAQGNGQQRRVEISSLHVRPTTGGTPLTEILAKSGAFEKRNFSVFHTRCHFVQQNVDGPTRSSAGLLFILYGRIGTTLERLAASDCQSESLGSNSS